MSMTTYDMVQQTTIDDCHIQECCNQCPEKNRIHLDMTATIYHGLWVQ